jgi:hypothetical protein
VFQSAGLIIENIIDKKFFFYYSQNEAETGASPRKLEISSTASLPS